jgi:hypothetical protein
VFTFRSHSICQGTEPDQSAPTVPTECFEAPRTGMKHSTGVESVGRAARQFVGVVKAVLPDFTLCFLDPLPVVPLHDRVDERGPR